MPFFQPKTIIAGPCSVESKEQLYQTALGLMQHSKVHILRAGVWKPRTSPSSFEGLGTKALGWLKEIQNDFKLPVAVEVATPAQIEEALAHGIQILWLGARTTVSPFSVQEIANALRGTGVSVLIKNPINPDINLWSGAVERLSKAGIEKMGLIHRGFSVLHQDLRYPPLWSLPIKMKERHKDLPMICDPSHISGKREHIHEVSQKALDLGMDGLMLESHISPEKAWSDSEQQLTPQSLSELLSSLNWKKRILQECTKTLELGEIEKDIEALIQRRKALLSDTQKIKLLP